MPFDRDGELLVQRDSFVDCRGTCRLKWRSVRANWAVQHRYFVDSTNGLLATISDVWSGVVDDLKATKDELKASKDEVEETHKQLMANQGRLAHKYDHLLNVIKGIESTLHTHEQQISYYSCKVVALENEKAKAVKAKFSALEERLERQEDVMSNLKDEIAYLCSVHCRCGEPAHVATSEVGELEYLDEEV